MKFLIAAIVALFLISGCLEPNRTDYPEYTGTGPYDDPNTDYYDTGNPSTDSGDCGYFEGPCCQWIGTDEFGMLSSRYYCNDGLECRAETCVEGAEYTAYDRTADYP
ncbi:hypothetical protein KKH30_00470 [Candidatus Micrarchaeota archaeon]|nr:hypothetical protein [Candidatus Micrarchaeota archaeon]MBU1939217.1 hypothetical protein [Candidatus Micrarchaeota archaeon]